MTHWTETDEWLDLEGDATTLRIPGGTLIHRESGAICFVPDIPGVLTGTPDTGIPDVMLFGAPIDPVVAWEEADWTDPPATVRPPPGMPSTTEYLVYDRHDRTGGHWDYHSKGRLPSLAVAISNAERIMGYDVMYARTDADPNVWERVWMRVRDA